MKRKRYFPDLVAERPEWFGNLANELPQANTILGMDAADVAARVADARYCEYLCGDWLTWIRECGPAATAAVETLFYGTSPGDYLAPVFTPPMMSLGDATATPPIPATVPVPAGALRRIQDFVKEIKSKPAYTNDLGLQLGIVGEEDSAEHPVPKFSLKLEDGAGDCQCVRIRFKKFGRQGVVVWSRRGGGAWEKLGIDLNSPYVDQRPLLTPGTPEVRDYRLQFYDDDAAIGDFSPTQSATVA